MFDHVNALVGTLIALAALAVAFVALRGQVRHDRQRQLEDQIDTQIKLARLAELERENRQLRDEAPEGSGRDERDHDDQ